MAEPEANVKEPMWRKLDIDIKLYKFYLDIAVKAAVFVFGITGALVSYHFSQKSPLTVYGLSFPLVVNLGFAILFYYSIDASNKFRDSHQETCQSLGITPAFNMNPLPSVCKIFSAMFLLAALGLALLMTVHVVQHVRHPDSATDGHHLRQPEVQAG